MRIRGVARPQFMGWNLLLVAAVAVVSMPAETAESSTATPQNVAAATVPADVEKALQLPKGTDQTTALCAAATDWAKKDPTAALAWAMKLPRDIPFAVHAVVTSTCALNSGKVSADWMILNSKPPNYGELHGLLFVWSSKGDAPSAAAWCAQAPKSARDIAFFSVGDGWYLKDQPAAADWASKLDSDDDRHSAIRGIALKWGRSNIPAATVWIKTLKPDEIQVAAKTIVGDWKQNKFKKDGARDDAAIKEWLEQFPLSAQEKEDMLKVPSPGIKK